jgi:hypothetical protein
MGRLSLAQKVGVMEIKPGQYISRQEVAEIPNKQSPMVEVPGYFGQRIVIVSIIQ